MSRCWPLAITVALILAIPNCHGRPNSRGGSTTADLELLIHEVRLLRNDLRNLRTHVEDIGNRLPGVNLSLVNKTDLANEIWAVLNRHLGSNSQDAEHFQSSECLLGSVLSLAVSSRSPSDGVDANGVKKKKTIFTPPSPSKLGKYRTAAISSDSAPCSEIGRDIMTEGGNAMDAAIAALFCNGVVNPQSAGIGGGFHMTIYDPATQTAKCLDARETAPLAATENMYSSNAFLSQIGGLAVAVPGELAGYWDAHQAYGRLPWARLVLPAALLAENGVEVNSHLAATLQIKAASIKAEPSMWIFLNETTGNVLRLGDTLKMHALAKTLKDIAEHGVDIFYKGSVGIKVVEDTQRRGGILTKDDLLHYRTEWMEPVSVDLSDNLTLYSMPSPGSGVLVAYVMNLLDGRLPEKRDLPASLDPLTYHRITEAFKHAFAQRTKLGDPKFVPEVDHLMETLASKSFADETFDKFNDSFTSNDPAFYGAVIHNPDSKGTSHISVLDRDGLAVSVTTTVNTYFGAGWISEQTGIIMNNEMDDFSSPNTTNFFGVPPSPANFIKPGKRPLSSMTPTIVVDSSTGKVRSVIGAAGGTRITTSVVYTLVRNLWFGENLKEAIDSYRIHHQLLPMNFQYESGFPKNIVESLRRRGHNVTEKVLRSAVYAISVEPDGLIYANADSRKGGDVAGIDPVLDDYF
ncbi:glutathione hydrolase 1 proenzyme-like [Daphnia pulex]|uniref:glutathione hydrolase 1 proenzyme-like n=1 Tax=Daphnia pulex TaxID=6669 RepID=UPI001EE0BA94|nr:glutathione hydrolase 1 proenzyme-like [Daphnia pulex]